MHFMHNYIPTRSQYSSVCRLFLSMNLTKQRLISDKI